MQQQGTHFPLLLAYIKEHRNQLVEAALQPGDTEILKGEVRGLGWVFNLLELILKTDTETETHQEGHGNGNGQGEHDG